MKNSCQLNLIESIISLRVNSIKQMTFINTIDTFVLWIEAIVKWVSDAPETTIAAITRKYFLFVLEHAIKWVLVTAYAMFLISRLVGYALCIYINQWLTCNSRIQTV